METLMQVLPIIIYFLLIIMIIVGIILGIKLIITIENVNNLVNDVKKKFDKVSPVFDVVGIVSDKMTSVFSTFASSVEGVVSKLFAKRNRREMESEEDE